MVHSGAIWNDVLEVGTAEKMLKARGQKDAFWRYLLLKLELLRKNQSKDSKCCILGLFETMFRKFELLRKKTSKDTKMYILTLVETMFIEVWNAEKTLIPRGKWCILALFEKMFWNCLNHFESKEAS